MLNIVRCSSHITKLEVKQRKKRFEWYVPAYRCVIYIEREKIQPIKSEIQ